MSVMGFKKKSLDVVSSILFLGGFLEFFNFAKPLTGHWNEHIACESWRSSNTVQWFNGCVQEGWVGNVVLRGPYHRMVPVMPSLQGSIMHYSSHSQLVTFPSVQLGIIPL